MLYAAMNFIHGFCAGVSCDRDGLVNLLSQETAEILKTRGLSMSVYAVQAFTGMLGCLVG